MLLEWLALLLQATWTGEGGETRKWSGVGGLDDSDLTNPCLLLFLGPGSFLSAEEQMEPSRSLP